MCEYYVNVHGNFAYLAQDDISRARIWRSMFGRLVPAMAHSATCMHGHIIIGYDMIVYIYIYIHHMYMNDTARQISLAL